MELRPLSSRQNLLQRADGSCHWKQVSLACETHADWQGKTEILAGVFGPVEPKGGRREDESKAELKVLFFPVVGHQNPETTTYQYFLQNMFEDVILLSLHPKYAPLVLSSFQSHLLGHLCKLLCMSCVTMARYLSTISYHSLSFNLTPRRSPRAAMRSLWRSWMPALR